jgi:Tfp pilus assembly protein FimV
VSFKTVCLLLGLCHAGAVAALGLGELNVRSFLGQPLHATVVVLDVGADLSADCFKLAAGTGAIAPPPRVDLSLQRNGDQTVLHIRTRQSLHDPIAQFVLLADCETRLQREYVILLDPPDPARLAQTGPTTPAPVQTTTPPAPRAAPAMQAPARPVPSARASTPRPPPAPRAQQAPRDEPAPRLVLSGRRSPQATAERPFALRLDSNLPNPAHPVVERPLTETELSDETTALSRRLAHLEAQLLALQRRNAELEARSRAAAVAPPPAAGPARWPLTLLLVGLLGGSILLVAWLRRRSRTHATDAQLDLTPWTQPYTSPQILSEMDTLPENDTPAPSRMAEVAAPPRAEDTEVKEDILDQAEVYMAHGHSDLAIHLLQEHLREAPTESPVPWLLLLDLLHRSGNAEAYTTASAECRRYFNVNLSAHPASQDGESSQGLEAYPHLLEKLVEVWNTTELDAFLHDLIYDDRGGTRIGFEPHAYRDILMLRAVAHDAQPFAA